MKSFIRKACFVLASALCTVAFTACENDDTAGGDLQLYYPTVIDIGPSMNYLSGAPSYHGPTPSEFVIERITCNDQQVETACFSIEAANGAVSIADTDELPTGTYKLSISCRAGGSKFRFSDIFVVQMVAAAPAELEVSEPTFDIPFDELETTEMAVTVTPVGETVSILSYALEQEEGREYFAISNKGVVTLNADFKGKILPGTYPLPISITTRAGKYTYENRLTVRITSAPLEIAYPVASGRMEVDHAFVSTGAPTMKGSPEQTVWAIEKITPSEGVGATDKIVIDSATGVISVEENSGLPLNAVYTLDLRVTNEFGSKVFEGAYTLTVIAYIEPIDPETFGYDKVEVIQGGAFSASPKAGLVGDEVKFELGELPAELVGQIEIDAMGAVSAPAKNKIPLGEYSIPVKVENIKSSAETTLTLSVVENPYYFTKIVYGNNLGLEPAENYANQYRCTTKNEYANLHIVPTTDAKPGTQLEWSMVVRHKCANAIIDSSTGELAIVDGTDSDGTTIINGGLVYVTATAGKGQQGETSVTVPVFFVTTQAVNGVKIVYTPFVLQVNPKVGGRSTAPTVEGVTDPSQFLLDYRRTFNYYNFNGPATHVNGASNKAGTFLYRYIWASYFNKEEPNGGDKGPMSYYKNTADTSKPAAYVDPATKEVVVNPNKWLDSDGIWASGMLHGEMTFVTDGKEGGINNGSKVQPIWIWFDENF